MTERVEIALCMGSSCFAKGNNTLLETVEDLIKARGWEERVTLSGLRCEERCVDGPNIRIDGKLYTAMDEGALVDALEARLGGGAKSDRITLRMSSVRRSAKRKDT